MQKFFKKNWLKIIIITLWILAISVFGVLLYLYYFSNATNELQVKQNAKKEIGTIEEKINTYEKLIEIKRREKSIFDNQLEIINDQIALTSLEIEKLKAEGADSSKIKEKQSYLDENQKEKEKLIAETQRNESPYQDMLKKVGEGKQEEMENFKCPESYTSSEQYVKDIAQFASKYKNITSDEVMNKRYDALVLYGCETTLFNIHLEEVMDSMIKFAGKEYGPPVNNVDKYTGVRSVYYPLSGQESGEADEEITFNFYIQDIWGEKPFTTRDVANIIADSDGKNNTHIIYKFEAPDPINKKPAFYFYTGYAPNQDTGYLFITKVASIGDDVYSTSFSKKILDSEKDQKFSDWSEKVINTYSKVLDIELPINLLGTVFDKERETAKLINN